MWNEWTNIIIYSLVTLLYGSVFTLLFLEVELSNRKNMFFFLGYFFVAMALQGLVLQYSDVKNVVYLYPVLVHLPLFLLCVLGYKRSVLTTVSSVMMSYFLTSPRYILAELVDMCIPSLPYAEYAGKIIASLILAYPIYRWVVPVMRKSFRRNDRDVIHFFAPLTILYTLSYLLYVYTDLLATNGILMVEIIFTLFFLFIFFYLQEYFVSMDEKYQEEKKNQMLVLSTDALKRQMEIISENNEQTRILRHDMRHYAAMIKQYAGIGEQEKVIAISEEIEKRNIAVTVKQYCSNPEVNLLLNTYISQLEEARIIPEVKISVPETIQINEMDFCVVLGNILDNALHSISVCRRDRFCSILLKYDMGKLYLEVQNSCEDVVAFQNGIPVSCRSGHGYGCKSVEYVAEKYYGICSFELKENVFISKVILHE